MNIRKQSLYMVLAAVVIATLACSPLGGAASPKATQIPTVAGVTQAPTVAAGGNATATVAQATAAQGEATATPGADTATPGADTPTPTSTYDTIAAQLTVPPLMTADAATAAAATGSLRQWAAAARASSQYGDTDWAASQAANAPDSGTDCGDSKTAWASANTNDLENLELAYAKPVVPVAVNIYEVYGPGSIIKVDVEEANGTAHTIYAGPPLPTTQCPRTFSIGVTGVTVPVNRVKIYFDLGLIGNWDEIDAVELVGNP
jgi:hypothetical protein